MTEIVRRRGGRMTEARRAMIRSLTEADGPLDLASLREGLADRGVSADRTTLYREIRYLMGAGLVREVSVVGFSKAYEPSGGHRHHLVCLGCRRIRSVDMRDRLGETSDRMLAKEGFEVVDHTLEFYGYCGRCRDNE